MQIIKYLKKSNANMNIHINTKTSTDTEPVTYYYLMKRQNFRLFFCPSIFGLSLANSMNMKTIFTPLSTTPFYIAYVGPFEITQITRNPNLIPPILTNVNRSSNPNRKRNYTYYLR